MPPKELTIRGLVLGVLLTTVFTAANVYLGLKVGLTFASSIPAAVNSSVISPPRTMLRTVSSASGRAVAEAVIQRAPVGRKWPKVPKVTPLRVRERAPA